MILDSCSEREIFGLLKIGLYIHRFFGCFMNRIAIYEYGLIWSCRTCILAMAAAYTYIVISFWYYKPCLKWDHVHSFCRTCFCTGTAGGLFSVHNTILFYKYCFADLRQFLCVDGKWHQSSGGANLKASCTFICAEALVKIQMRLHH